MRANSLWVGPSFCVGGAKRSARADGLARAFTLLELLVVIAILGMVAALALPAIKGIGRATVMTAATRQLADDVAAAAQHAISQRSEVYIVFVPPYSQWTNRAGLPINWSALALSDRRVATNLLGGQYTSYAIFAARQVGDQPGQSHPRYLTPWRSLPTGTFFAAHQFWGLADINVIYQGTTNKIRSFVRRTFPFPTTSGVMLELPCTGFSSEGRVTTVRQGADYESVALALGSVMPVRDANSQLVARNVDGDADVLETPLGNSTNTFNIVRIDWLTGRPRVVRKQIQ